MIIFSEKVKRDYVTSERGNNTFFFFLPNKSLTVGYDQ